MRHTVAAIADKCTRMKTLALASALAAATLIAPARIVPASAQDDATPYDGAIEYGTIEYGEVLPGADAADAYGVPLAPGEEIIGIFAAPSVIQIPVDSDVIYQTMPYTPPEAEIDRVTGLPRNTAGWTGDSQGPAAIGCFPEGVCADLN